MKFKHYFFLFFIAFIFYFLPLNSYASLFPNNPVIYRTGPNFEYWISISPGSNHDFRIAYIQSIYQNRYVYPQVICPADETLTFHARRMENGVQIENGYFSCSSSIVSTSYGDVRVYPYPAGQNSKFTSLYNDSRFTIDYLGATLYDSLEEASRYVLTGYVPELPFDETLELDYFKVSTYEEFFNSFAWDNVFKVGWSDERISQVQVIISSTLRKDSFESSQSPFKSSFAGSTYAQTNGDVISLIATPYKSDGTYGPSLYYSFVYNSNLPLTNVWRKNHTYNFQDNTIQIPYTGVSGNDTVEAPVSGIKQDTCYKIYYNPTTEEITNENVYNIYYSPVIVYPENTPSEVIQETQETVINDYTTNNYYTTTNQINYSFNIDFEDISANDVQQTYDDVGGFFNGLGSFISKLVSIFQLLFPFLPDGLAAFIIIAFGIIALFVVVALALKIAGVITNLLP